jgi:hypothetical protein
MYFIVSVFLLVPTKTIKCGPLTSNSSSYVIYYKWIYYIFAIYYDCIFCGLVSVYQRP